MKRQSSILSRGNKSINSPESKVNNQTKVMQQTSVGRSLKRSSSRLSRQASILSIENMGPPEGIRSMRQQKSVAQNSNTSTTAQPPNVKKQESHSSLGVTSRKSVGKKNLKVDIVIPPKSPLRSAQTLVEKPNRGGSNNQQQKQSSSYGRQISFSEPDGFEPRSSLRKSVTTNAIVTDDQNSKQGRGMQQETKTSQRKQSVNNPLSSQNSLTPSRKRDQKAGQKALSRLDTIKSKSSAGKSAATTKQVKSLKSQGSFKKSATGKRSYNSKSSDKRTNRTRKSACQKDALWELYKELDGKTPPRERILQLAEELNLKINQIYKWFWDTKKKVEEDTKIARSMQFGGNKKQMPPRSDSKGNLMTPVEKPIVGVDGTGGGERMTPQQIKTALKIHKMAAEKEADFESIAMKLGLNIEQLALQIVSAPSPTNRRQIVRKVNAPSTGKSSFKVQQSFSMNPSFSGAMFGQNANNDSGMGIGAKQQAALFSGADVGNNSFKNAAGFNSVPMRRQASRGRGSASKSNDMGPQQSGRLAKQMSGFGNALRQTEHQFSIGGSGSMNKQGGVGQQHTRFSSNNNNQIYDNSIEDDAYFAPIQKYPSMRSGLLDRQEAFDQVEGNDSFVGDTRVLRNQRSISRQHSLARQQQMKSPNRQMISPMMGFPRTRLVANTSNVSETIDREGMIMNRAQEKQEDQIHLGANPLMTPIQSYMGQVPGIRGGVSDLDQQVADKNNNAGSSHFLTRMNTGNKEELDFEQMLMSNQNPVMMNNQSIDMKKQASVSGMVAMNSIYNNMPASMGETGTTRNEYGGGGGLYMNRNQNISIEMMRDHLQQSNQQQISPFIDASMKKKILNPTPVRYTHSFLTNTNSSNNLPNFGGGDNQ